MDLRASACRGAARIKAVRAPRVADSGATPRRPVRRAGGRARTRPAPGGRGQDRADPRRGRPEWPTLSGLAAVRSALLPRRSAAHSPGPPASGAAADASPGGARGRDAETRVRPPRRAGTGRATRRPAELRPTRLPAPGPFPAGRLDRPVAARGRFLGGGGSWRPREGTWPGVL